jgi:predicted tellurium resistance membrane protein TerC
MEVHTVDELSVYAGFAANVLVVFCWFTAPLFFKKLRMNNVWTIFLSSFIGITVMIVSACLLAQTINRYNHLAPLLWLIAAVFNFVLGVPLSLSAREVLKDRRSSE